jgi:hypothetical protein
MATSMKAAINFVVSFRLPNMAILGVSPDGAEQC